MTESKILGDSFISSIKLSDPALEVSVGTVLEVVGDLLYACCVVFCTKKTTIDNDKTVLTNELMNSIPNNIHYLTKHVHTHV